MIACIFDTLSSCVSKENEKTTPCPLQIHASPKFCLLSPGSFTLPNDHFHSSWTPCTLQWDAVFPKDRTIILLESIKEHISPLQQTMFPSCIMFQQNNNSLEEAGTACSISGGQWKTCPGSILIQVLNNSNNTEAWREVSKGLWAELIASRTY